MENRKIKILAIDDTPDNLICLKAQIKDSFPEALVFTALNGGKGIELATAEVPDVILLDIVMPGMNGYEVCRLLKAEEKNRNIPVVLVSAIKGDRESRIRGLECGAEALLAKPIFQSELVAQIYAMVKIKDANIINQNEKELLSQLVDDRVRELKLTQKATLNLLEDLRNEVETRKQSETKLQASEEHFKAVTQTANDAIITINADGNVTGWNNGAEKIFGYSEAEIAGKNLTLIMPQHHREQHNHGFNRVINGGDHHMTGKTAELVGLHKNGTEFPVELSLSEWQSATGKFFTGIIRDISERKQAEEKIREIDIQFRKLLSNVPDMVFQFTRRTDGTYCVPVASEGIRNIYGCSPEDVTDDFTPIFKLIYPEDSARQISAIEYSAEHLIPFDCEYRAQLPGQEIKWLHCKSTPELLADGSITWYGFIMDITKRKLAEQELIIAKDHAEQSDQLKSAFLANMSHEIRTPMNGILGFAELLQEPGLTGEQQQEYIRIIQKSGDRMLNIINNIVDISRIEANLMNVDIKDSNINEKIEFIYMFFKPQVEEKGMQLLFKNTLPAKEATIKTDNEKVYAILTNLVKNAIKYSEKGSIEFGYDLVETHGRASVHDLQFYVKDTGIGIPKDRQEAIFERFIQADIEDKKARQGVGLGLSISKAYVEMLGGKIWVESEEGIGSTFYFTLPYNNELVEKKVFKQVVPLLNEKNQISNLKILIAEDDETSEMLIYKTVETFGREILKVRTGVKAVEACRDNPDIDLVLMDILMPEMDGYEAARRIRQFNKDLIIIAQTGYGLQGDREKAIKAGCNDHISKPINKAELASSIQKLFMNRIGTYQ